MSIKDKHIRNLVLKSNHKLLDLRKYKNLFQEFSPAKQPLLGHMWVPPGHEKPCAAYLGCLSWGVLLQQHGARFAARLGRCTAGPSNSHAPLPCYVTKAASLASRTGVRICEMNRASHEASSSCGPISSTPWMWSRRANHLLGTAGIKAEEIVHDLGTASRRPELTSYKLLQCV